MCNRTVDSCSHKQLHSGHNPKVSNNRNRPAVGTGCTGHSSVYTLLSWAAMICAPSAAACSLNSEDTNTALHYFYFVFTKATA